MIICPNCASRQFVAHGQCPGCGFSVACIDGFRAWAPELAKRDEGEQPEFAQLAKVEAASFWFRSRNALIEWAVRTYFPGSTSLLEVGCGTGFVLSGLVKAFSSMKLSGSELYTSGLHFAATRLPDVDLAQMDARRLPFSEEFELIGAFDVIEHIKEDELVLQNFHRALKPGGGCLITVPQHRWLWSPVDVQAHHERRYTADELHGKLRSAGFEVLRSTSFVTFLLPVMLLSRELDKLSGKSGAGGELQLPPLLDRLFEISISVERKLIKLGISLAFGGSRLVVARKLG
jgi:SAM-dependent methyltransferase